MEYELIGQDGKTHDRFDDHDEAFEAVWAEEQARPGATAGWVVQLYDEDGNEVGEPERAEDVLAQQQVPAFAIRFVIHSHSEGRGVFMPQPQEGLSGTATPIRRGFRRPPSDAIGTHVLPAGETVGGR